MKSANAEGVYESAEGALVADTIQSCTIEYWEPLNLGPFSCLPQTMECKTLPNWHPNRQCGLGLPMVNSIVINAQMNTNFAGNMINAISRGFRGGATETGTRKITLNSIDDVELFATVFKPPQLWVGASHASYVIPTWACERCAEPVPPMMPKEQSMKMPLKYHTFEKFPGAFIITVGPERNSKWSYISGTDSMSGGSTTAAGSYGDA